LPLFVYLLLGRERPIARDQLAYKFWPDYSEVEARANLRRHLHRINAPLADVSKNRWLDVDDKFVTFNARMPLDLDVAQLEAACANPEAAPNAVDIYTGDLFEGCDEDWLIPHRERLRTAYLRLLFGLIDRYRGERRFAEAIALSRKAMHVDPLREDLVRTLMSLHYESGNRSSALTEFDVFRERLQTELGVQPMHETQSLHDAIRRHAPLGVRTDRPASERMLPFEGRDGEIETLRNAWHQAASGKSRVAMVSGEAGIGKTRLLREFAILAEREGARVLWGASSAPEASPFEPVIEALTGAIAEIGRLSLSPALLATLTARFPELRAMRPDLPESVELIGQRERERLFDAIALATERLCVARPAVIVFEDVHWVFADTFELMARVIRTCARSPLFVIISFREEQMTSALRSFRQDPALKSALRMGLDRLASSSCRKILLGYENVPVSFANRAIELANGNPLFLSELIREGGANAAPCADEPRTMPATLEAAILARMSSLSGPARALLDIAAIGGTVVSIDQVQYVSGWPLAHVLNATDELVDRFVLRETTAGSRGDYEFAHELIREAVLQSMSIAVQMRRHRRFAAAILELFPARRDDFARTIAQHFEKAGQREQAAQFYARAANMAHGQFAWHDAIVFGDHALRLESRPAERFSLYAAIESAAQKLGDVHRQDAAITRLIALADELDDDTLRATALNRLSEVRLQTGDFVRQRVATDQLESIARKHADSSLLAKALRCRARGDIARGRPASAVATLHSIDALHGLDRSSSEQVDDLRMLAHAQAAATAFEAARAAIEEAERRAGAPPSLPDQIAIVRTRAMLAVEMADREEAGRLSPILLDLCRKIGDVEGEGNAHQVAARIDWWSFDVASAREHLRAAAAIFERIGKPQSRASVANNAGALENHVGLLDDAERFYAEALGYADGLDSQGLRGLCHANVAYVALLRRDGARAFAEAQQALEISRASNDRRLVAITLGHSASALRILGRDGTRAVDMFGEALQICVESGFVDERLEIIAEMIPLLVSCRTFEQAALFASELERAISANENAVVMPIDALAKAAEAFEAIGQSARANTLYTRARSLLRDRLDKLPDARTRSAYAALHVHHALLERDDHECA
jgi:DNA-binding SARP family transcriptional activator